MEQHLSAVLRLVRPLEPIEVDLLQAQGRVLAEAVSAGESLPRFDNSAMDGYAVRAADVAAATQQRPVLLPVVADIAAGEGAHHGIADGVCARIMTGAPMPTGADTVVPVEWTDGEVAQVRIYRAPRRGNAVRRVGEDVAAGTTLLEHGTRMGAGEIGVAAALGRRTVRVYPAPRVAVLATGEELVDPGRPLGPGQIWDSNSFTLVAAVAEAGARGRRQVTVGDDPADVLEALRDAALNSDLVITTGGVSMGAYDVVKEVLTAQGTVSFDKVAVQPGMPQGAGRLGDPPVPVLTLPGNPVSSYVSFQLFALPALRRMQGLDPDPRPTVRARLLRGVTSPDGRRSYLRGVLSYAPDASATRLAHTVDPMRRQGSHQLSALAEANALIVVPEHLTELAADAEVEVVTLP